ncbi:MAG: M48 family peptidase [Chloroflexi bacterium]|nr:MAG: M48 family peptidase [Chloroflexota bacterium]
MTVRRQSSARRGGSSRILIAVIIAVISLITYFGSRQYNEVTDEVQYIDVTVAQEIALGLQAAPQMAQQYGGESPDRQLREMVERIGVRIVQGSNLQETGYQFDFHLLADAQTVNAFALPGGQVFVTVGLLNLLQTEGELAGVLGHEIGHVVARHSAEHMAKAKLTEGLSGAAVMAAYDPDNPNSVGVGQMAALVGQMVNMKFGRDDELESDKLGVRFIAAAGYDPRALIGVMEALAKASGGSRQPEFLSSHPNPENRVEKIQEAIAAEFPAGLPEGLTP